MAKIVLACDVYGTILDTSAVSDALGKQLGVVQRTVQPGKPKEIAAAWRKYQLEYTWRLNSMGAYEDFSAVTRKALLHACADAGVSLADDAVDTLMTAYELLPSYEDAVPAWQELSKDDALELVIFSNGTKQMVSSALRGAQLAPMPEPARFVLADEVRKFKPAREVYEHLLQRVGRESHAGQVWLVSSNPFDVVGARSAAMNAVWVDRSGAGWADRLGSGLGPGGRDYAPTRIVRSLAELAELMRAEVAGGGPMTL